MPPEKRHYYLVSFPDTGQHTQESQRLELYHTLRRAARVTSIEANLKEQNFILLAENDRLKEELEGKRRRNLDLQEKRERTRLKNLIKKYGVPT